MSSYTFVFLVTLAGLIANSDELPEAFGTAESEYLDRSGDGGHPLYLLTRSGRLVVNDAKEAQHFDALKSLPDVQRWDKALGLLNLDARTLLGVRAGVATGDVVRSAYRQVAHDLRHASHILGFGEKPSGLMESQRKIGRLFLLEDVMVFPFTTGYMPPDTGWCWYDLRDASAEQPGDPGENDAILFVSVRL